jgi:Hemerythrin HHE cation binding domain
MLIRSLNAIYIQATSVSSPADISDFLVYCQCWYEVVHHHHRIEEEFFFPEVEKALNKPGLMATDVAQHQAFHDKMDVWGKQCYSLTSNTSKYNGNEWRQLIDDFSVPLVKHLHEEIDSMQRLEGLDAKNVITNQIWLELDKRAQGDADKVASRVQMSLVLLLMHNDCSREIFRSSSALLTRLSKEANIHSRQSPPSCRTLSNGYMRANIKVHGDSHQVICMDSRDLCSSSRRISD